jgi:hypothetical protein
MNTPAEAAGPEQPDEDVAPVLPASASVSVTAVSVTQSREDTDAGWGEYGGRDDDERLLRDRPPHWG